MTVEIKEDILKRLADTHRDLEEAIDGMDLELVIHPETKWEIRDILGHIATWDRVLIEAINSYLSGSVFIIPDMVGDETDYNETQVVAQRKIATSDLHAEWIQAREDFIETVGIIPPGKFSDQLDFPWGDERGSLELMIEYMVEHNGEHQEEILKALT